MVLFGSAGMSDLSPECVPNRNAVGVEPANTARAIPGPRTAFRLGAEIASARFQEADTGSNRGCFFRFEFVRDRAGFLLSGGGEGTGDNQAEPRVSACAIQNIDETVKFWPGGRSLNGAVGNAHSCLPWRLQLFRLRWSRSVFGKGAARTGEPKNAPQCVRLAGEQVERP
jgi:hypothetical protein